MVKTPKAIVEDIVNAYGRDAIRLSSHISVITELFGNEEKYLLMLEELKRELKLICPESNINNQ